MIFAVLAEVFREIIDALGQDRDLNLGGPGVTLMGPVLLNRRRFIESHFLKIPPLRRVLVSLTRYAVDYRYPNMRATTRQMQAALRHAEQVRFVFDDQN